MQRPAENDSISAAGRELDALKTNAANAANTPGSSALPPVSVPQLQQSAEAPVPLPQPRAATDPLKAKRSANWLVDAMMKPAEKKDRDRGRGPRDRHRAAPRDRGPGAEDGDLTDRTEDATSPGDLDSQSDRSASSDHAPTTPTIDQAFNPLARYMAGWLAPQDFALLRRTLDRPAETSPTGVQPSSAIAGVDIAGSDSDVLAGLLGSNKAANPVVAAKPADNPYLESLSLPVAPPPPPVSAPVATPPPDVSLAPSPQPAPEPARPIIPPFVRPAMDDKYFKPLKRF